jgi:hypothetical protein
MAYRLLSLYLAMEGGESAVLDAKFSRVCRKLIIKLMSIVGTLNLARMIPFEEQK